MNDRIFLEGIKFHGFHGLTRMERQVGVRLAVDVTLETSLERSGSLDRVSATIDYRKVHERVIELEYLPKALTIRKSHKLLESFAHSLIHDLFSRFSADRITVRVRKETPVLDGIVDAVGVVMSRNREEVVGA